MYKIKESIRKIGSWYTEVKFGDAGSCPVDQKPSMDFNIDASTGRPMEDITALIRASDDLEARSLANSMPDFRSSSLDDDVSDEDAIKFMKPSLCQLPSELKRFHESVGQFMLDKKAELENKKKEERQAAIDESIIKQLGIQDNSAASSANIS